MASFEEHILQAKKNLLFLTETNLKNQSFWDWQITVSFYISVHLVNAHIAKVANLHYRTHEDVKNALNPHNPLSVCRVSEEIYLCYAKIEGLSRRARYLCHDDPKNSSTQCHFTHDKHFAKTLKKLDILLDHFTTLYSLTHPKPKVSCLDLTVNDRLKVFEISNKTQLV